MLLRAALVCVALCATAHAEDDAALLKRVRGAFRNLRTTDDKLKSLRLDVTLPFLGGAVRVRVAYAAPDRYCLAILSEDARCPIGIARERGMIMYDVVRGRVTHQPKAIGPKLAIRCEEGPRLKFELGVSWQGEEAPETKPDGFQLDLADLLRVAPERPSAQRTKQGLRYEAYSKRGSKLVAHLTDTAEPTVTRLELWPKDGKSPVLLVDRIEVDQPLPDGCFPDIPVDAWKGIAPIEPLFPAEWSDPSDQESLTRRLRVWTAAILGYGAVEQEKSRDFVLPRAGAALWQKAKLQHREFTPRILAQWRKLYGPALPGLPRMRVIDIDDDVVSWEPAEPTEEERTRAVLLLKRIRNHKSGDGDLERIAVRGTEWAAGRPAFLYRLAVDGNRFGFYVVSRKGTVPIAVADEDDCLLFDASGGRLLELPNARAGARLELSHDGPGISIALDVKNDPSPRLTLGFRDVIDGFPEARRAFSHPTHEGWSILEARHAKIGRLRYVCDPKATPIVREVWFLPRESILRVYVLGVVPDGTKIPHVTTEPFGTLLPRVRLDAAGERWRVKWGEEERPISPLYFLAFERLALLEPELRVGLPDRSKQHWIAFEQRENEITPEVTRIWRKAFGTLR